MPIVPSGRSSKAPVDYTLYESITSNFHVFEIDCDLSNLGSLINFHSVLK